MAGIWSAALAAALAPGCNSPRGVLRAVDLECGGLPPLWLLAAIRRAAYCGLLPAEGIPPQGAAIEARCRWRGYGVRRLAAALALPPSPLRRLHKQALRSQQHRPGAQTASVGQEQHPQASLGGGTGIPAGPEGPLSGGPGALPARRMSILPKGAVCQASRTPWAPGQPITFSSLPLCQSPWMLQ